jgi:hypothetical protein
MRTQTLAEFVDRFGGKDMYPVIDVGGEAADWPSFIVRAGAKAAVVQFMNIDVHPFVDERAARASAFGMEEGRRLAAFTEADTAGTSQGLPGAPSVSVIVGAQAASTAGSVRVKHRSGCEGAVSDLVCTCGAHGETAA